MRLATRALLRCCCFRVSPRLPASDWNCSGVPPEGFHRSQVMDHARHLTDVIGRG